MGPAIIVAWTLVLLAIAFLAVAAGLLVVAQQQTTWTKVPGRVVRSRVEYRGEDFVADIAYTYSFGGEESVGSTVGSFQIVYNWRGPAERKCARYPEGGAVTAYVDPGNPKRSMLEAPPSGAAPFFLCVSILCGVLGFALM